jgi:hypothetical protein
MTPCTRCNKERAVLIHGLCNACNDEVDAQIERNFEFARIVTVALKAELNWSDGTRE